MTAIRGGDHRGIGAGDLLMVLAAGVVGELVLETLAFVAFPAVLGMPMRPDILISAVGGNALGIAIATPFAIAIHLALGAFIFPLLYLMLSRRLSAVSPWLVAVLWGALLWLLAQSTLAPLAGRPAFLGFVPYTWGSLCAHIVYALTVAAMLRKLRTRFPDLR